jgi:hypothetical protein
LRVTGDNYDDDIDDDDDDNNNNATSLLSFHYNGQIARKKLRHYSNHLSLLIN